MPEDLNALDQELSELLAVEPSPEFAARIRARIEEPAPPRAAWRFWMIAAIPAAAAAVLFIVVVLGRGARDVQPPAPAHADVTLPSPSVPVIRPPADAVPKQVRRQFPGVRRTLSPQPEVLIDPSLAAAVRRLTADQRVLPEVPPERSLAPVVVEPLKVPEIADTGNKQGDRQ